MAFTQFRFPKPLEKNSLLAITGPSGGVHPRFHARLDLVLQTLRDRGYRVIEGQCLRNEKKHVSAEKSARARELQALLTDDSIDAICPPWGGEVLIEILPLLDFEKIARAKPKWITSYSDISTLHFALTTRTGIATAHTPNLMDWAPLPPQSPDQLTGRLWDALTTPPGGSFTQNSSPVFQKSARIDFEKDPGGTFAPSEPARWKSLKNAKTAQFSGRLIGGCLDTISCLTGTPHGNLENFKRVTGKDGVIFYFENCEGSPPAVVRMIQNLKQCGWLEGLNGILIGRSSGPNETGANALTYVEALHWALDDLNVPILYDADIGHQPPQMSLINGAKAEVTYSEGQATLKQTFG